ncbi:MAG: pilus assembly protein PilP [Deltaproteobacteria bacterium]|nr:pilus assembly protein PilP [Deltaproteobacteria bacterium]
MVAKLKQLSLLTAALFMAFGILSLVPGKLVFALNQTGEVKPAITMSQGNHPTFSYDSLGKPDPFRPFINFNAIERPIPTEEPKTPLERYSLNQFKLVGILLADKHFAMVEDPEQISYTIIEGEKLGNLSGTVEEIRENEIIIAEPYLDIYDQQQIRKITLKLHVEEDPGGKIQ